MDTENFSYYVSHIVRCKDGEIKKRNGESISSFFIQIITSKNSDKKSVCWINNGVKKFYNCNDLQEAKAAVKNILSQYYKFDFEILFLDKAYEEGLSIEIVSSFINGSQNMQEKIDLYKLKKDLN